MRPDLESSLPVGHVGFRVFGALLFLIGACGITLGVLLILDPGMSIYVKGAFSASLAPKVLFCGFMGIVALLGIFLLFAKNATLERFRNSRRKDP